MNRAELVKLVGELNVKELESVNCEPTSRLMQSHEDHLTEFAATLNCKNRNGEGCTISAYYYLENEWLEETDDEGYFCNSLDYAEWIIQRYEIQ